MCFYIFIPFSVLPYSAYATITFQPTNPSKVNSGNIVSPVQAFTKQRVRTADYSWTFLKTVPAHRSIGFVVLVYSLLVNVFENSISQHKSI